MDEQTEALRLRIAQLEAQIRGQDEETTKKIARLEERIKALEQENRSFQPLRDR